MIPSVHIHLRDAVAADFEAILRLNVESEHFLSPLDLGLLEALHAQAVHRRVIEVDGTVRGFLLALREGTPYQSLNYRWFCDRYAQFLYIDRVVVDAAVRGQRLGLRLYEDVFARARAQGIQRITCEYDIDPPNEGSRQFHARLGFREVGTQRAAGGKAVSMQELML